MRNYQLICNVSAAKHLDTLGEFRKIKDFMICDVIISSKSEKKNIMTLCERAYKAHSFVALRAKEFKAKAVFFDMDGTLIREESLVVLAQKLGLEKKIHHLTKKAMEGEISFKESFRERMTLLKGVNESYLEETAKSLNLYPGLRNFLSYLKTSEIPYFLISGGLDKICQVFAKDLGFTDCCANSIEILDGKTTGNLQEKLIDDKAKVFYMIKKSKELGISTNNVVAIGDGANDSLMLEEAGLAVGFCPKKVLYPVLDVYQGLQNYHLLLDFFRL